MASSQHPPAAGNRCRRVERRPRFRAAFAAAPAVACTLLLGAAAPAPAHEVPGSVTVQVLVRQQGDRLQTLVRVPLEAMQEMQFPTDHRGILDLGELQERDGLLVDAAERWITPNLLLFAGADALPEATVRAARLSIPSDRSFVDLDSALAHLGAPPLPETAQLPWRQALLDVLLDTPLGDAARAGRPRLSIDPRFGRLGVRVLTVIRHQSPDGESRLLQIASEPGRIRLDPNWAQASAAFVGMGFRHILGGIDHLLFLVCLVAPLRRLRQLVLVVTSFTVAHSITLLASAAGLAPSALWFPTLVETLIALSIVWMAFENILGIGAERRWTAAFGFGLVHGFGFSFALAESLQFAGAHLAASLLAFNVGVELGQLLVLLFLVPVLDAVLGRLPSERIGTILISALIAHTAWHWSAERGADLLLHRPWTPALDVVPDAALPWLLALVAATPAMIRWSRRHRGDPPISADAAPPPGRGRSDV